jgi:uncharacterized protein YodC (DUF2158 family)
MTKNLSDGTEVASSWAPGKLVVLPSGGPGMTVVDVGRHTGLVWCRWIGVDGSVCEREFPAETLRSDPRSHLNQP